MYKLKLPSVAWLTAPGSSSKPRVIKPSLLLHHFNHQINVSNETNENGASEEILAGRHDNVIGDKFDVWLIARGIIANAAGNQTSIKVSIIMKRRRKRPTLVKLVFGLKILHEFGQCRVIDCPQFTETLRVIKPPLIWHPLQEV